MNSTQVHHGLVKARFLGLAVGLVAAGSAFVVSPAAAADLPPCLPPIEAMAKVATVQDNGVLVLEHHRTVRLEGLLWPGEAEGAPTAIRRQTAAALRKLLSKR